jgi:ectoine hydroxylase-related dioxygenase (phytanoyl-CoA dioxygenase family)
MAKADSVLPRARDVAEAKRQLDEQGLTIMEDVLDAAGIAAAMAALKRGVEADATRGVQLHGFSFDPDTRNTRVFDLVGKDRVFRDLVEHPVAVELTTHLIGAPFLLSNFSANVTAPGSGAMGMHADQGYVPAPWPPYPLAINVGWALDDFTVANGATRFVPGPHKRITGRTGARATRGPCRLPARRVRFSRWTGASGTRPDRMSARAKRGRDCLPITCGLFSGRNGTGISR